MVSGFEMSYRMRKKAAYSEPRFLNSHRQSIIASLFFPFILRVNHLFFIAEFHD
jgi:hypothetical protein